MSKEIPNPPRELTQEEIDKIQKYVKYGQIHIADALSPFLTDEEKRLIAEGKIQNPEWD